MRADGTGITPSGPQLAALAAGIRTVNLDAATQALTAAQSGQHFIGAVDAVFTLPAATDVAAGTWFSFECGVASSGTGLSISPAAADGIATVGATTGVVNKDLINSGASDVVGDHVAVVCTGTTGTRAWQAFNMKGTWAKEA